MIDLCCQVADIDNEYFRSVAPANISPSRRQAEALYYLMRASQDLTVRENVADSILQSKRFKEAPRVTHSEVLAIYEEYGAVQESFLNQFVRSSTAERIFSKSRSEWLDEAVDDSFCFCSEEEFHMADQWIRFCTLRNSAKRTRSGGVSLLKRVGRLLSRHRSK